MDSIELTPFSDLSDLELKMRGCFQFKTESNQLDNHSQSSISFAAQPLSTLDQNNNNNNNNTFSFPNPPVISYFHTPITSIPNPIPIISPFHYSYNPSTPQILTPLVFPNFSRSLPSNCAAQPPTVQNQGHAFGLPQQMERTNEIVVEHVRRVRALRPD